MKRPTHCAIAGVLIAASLAASAATAPFTSGRDAAPLSAAEQRVWWSADEVVEVIARSGSLYTDEAATRYVQRVADRLFPATAPATSPRYRHTLETAR